MESLFRRWLGIGLLVLTTVAINETTFAALNLYEPFNYTAGQGLAGVDGQVGSGGATGNVAASVVPSPQGGTGAPYGQLAPNGNYWMSAGYTNNSPYSQTNDAVTVATDLSYSGLADPTTGGSIELGGTGSTPRIAFTPIYANPNYSNDSIPVNAYYSLLVQIKDISNLQAIGGLIGGFNNVRGSQGNNPSTVGASLWIRGSSGNTKFQFGVAEQSVNANNSPVFDTTQEFDFNQTYLIVGKYTIRGTLNSGTSDDTAQIWINPASSTFGGPDPAGALIASINNTDIPSNQTDPAGGNPIVQTFVFRQDGTVGANSPTDYLIDDLRVGTTYADVTPGPVLGDYNGNGVVDAADYVIWKKGGPLQNEVDTPGTVNAADYTEWRARFGNPVSGAGTSLGSQPVPEPATIVLFAGFVVSFCCRRQLRLHWINR